MRVCRLLPATLVILFVTGTAYGVERATGSQSDLAEGDAQNVGAPLSLFGASPHTWFAPGIGQGLQAVSTDFWGTTAEYWMVRFNTEGFEYPVMNAPSAICGNGVVDGTETCDDGLAVSGDGCSSTCTIEPGYTCVTEFGPSICTDIDECATGAYVCEPNRACKNTPGAYTCVCAMGYWGVNSCKACGAGSYNPLIGQTNNSACLPCGAGTYNALSGQATCKACAKGSYSGPGAMSCTLCPTGTYNPLEGSSSSTACLACQPGYHGPSTGAEACTPCAPGSYSASAGAVTCTACPTGTYNELFGQVECSKCPPGTFRPFEGGDSEALCWACAAGRFNPNSGSHTCYNCPPGSSGTEVGAVECEVCPPGRYQPEQGQVSCLGCPAGRYSEVFGSTALSSCLYCPKGTFNPYTGNDFCTECQPGFWNDQTGSTSVDACRPCPAGTFGPGYSLPTVDWCLRCPAGTASPAPGAGGIESCAACEPGRYADDMGNVSCSPCPVGTDAQMAGSVECHLCVEGHFAATEGTPSCPACEPGTYGSEVGLVQCSSCLPGTYADQPGSLSCLSCQPGYQSQGGAAACTAICGDGLVLSGEVCDDGNTDPADGCDGCVAEGLGWHCPVAGQPCIRTCVIGGLEFMPGAANPSNPCQGCNPAQSQWAWTNLLENTPCVSDGLVCTKDACDAGGSCTHVLLTGCLIQGNCVAADAQDPTAECRVCDPARATTTFSDKAKGVPCSSDGMPWTMDVCDTGECSHANTGECVIAGTHWAGGASHPTNPCQWCDAASSQSDWTNRSQGFPCTSDGLACTSDVCGGNGVCGHTLFAGCLISGACVVAGDDSPATECLACDPALDAFDYTPKAAGTQCVDDGLLGTMDVCDGWGLCTHTQTDSCVVDGVLFAGGASNPENVCLVCDSAADPEGWTPRSQGFKCGSDGLECTSDVCDGVGFCVHPTYKGCLIDNVCLGDGAPNPSNICLECQAALDNSNWSPLEQGVTCGDDGDSSTVDVCDGAGLCTHNVQEFCVIGGITYEALAVNPDNSCELCDGTVAPFAWTLRSEGESCEDEGNACTLDVCDGFGACQHQLAPVSACEDKNACTDDWCDAMLGCVHGANADPCDDGNLCTDGDACADGTCQGGTTSTCNDGLLCTVDSCQPEVGCIFTPLVDSDADGICDALDNCPEIPNQDQADEDFNGVGDLCEPAPEPNPESVDDVITQDLSDGDLAVQDLFAEDLAEPDQNPADLATPDQATQDTSDPDAVLPDLASPDQSSPDQSSPDLALPDLGNPDAVEPDAVQPDSIEPDVLAPDLSKSDLSQVDGWAHDVSSDAQSDDTLEADSGGEKPTSPGGGGSCAAGGAAPSSPSIGAILLLLAVALALWFRKR